MKNKVWTEDEDNILIDNYESFKSLDKKSRFELLAQLLTGKTAKECYYRAKELRLKKKGADYARDKSKVLTSLNDRVIRDLKISSGVRKFLTTKIGGN